MFMVSVFLFFHLVPAQNFESNTIFLTFFTNAYILRIKEYRSMIAILLIMSVIFTMLFIWTLVNGISPMPTSPKVKKTLTGSLPPVLDGTIVDLGSGWGTLAFSLAKKYPNCLVVGYETSPIPYYYSKIVQRFFGPDTLQFKRKDLYKAPCHHATLIVCYLYPKAMEKLKQKFENECMPSTLIVSHTFAIPNWKPIKRVEVQDLYKTKIYFYLPNSPYAMS
jgi:hypothetical protein